MRKRTLLRHALLLAALTAWLLAVIPVAGERDAPYDETRRRIRVPILMYHYLSVPPEDADRYRRDLSVTPAQFAEQLAWLAEHDFTAVSLDDVYAALSWGQPLPPRPVVLTFDDGYADAFENAFPLLRRFDMTATFFIVTEWLDHEQPGYLTWTQARTMAEAGMSIQSHSRSHPDLTDDCDFDCRVFQILGSVESIEVQVGTRPRFFCYPSGRYDADVLHLLDQVGIVAAVTTHSGARLVSDRLLELPRVRVRGTTTIADFAWLVNDWND